MHPVHAMFLQFPALEKKIICRCDRRHPSSKSLGGCAGSSPWSVSMGQWSVAISLLCFTHTQLIFRLPKEAHFPDLWGRCLSDQRRTRWPSERPGLGMNNRSENGNQNNNKSISPKQQEACELTAEIQTEIRCYVRVTAFQQSGLGAEEENSETEK